MNVCMIPVTPLDTFRGHAEERVYVQHGSSRVASSPTLITTVLGSSVAVCLWSPAVAGMSHYILPRGGHEKSSRYGNHALPMLLERMLEACADQSELLAAVFGGASILRSAPDAGLGARNVIEAKEFLQRHEIPMIRESVGGHDGRKLTFRTIDGSTIVRKL